MIKIYTPETNISKQKSIPGENKTGENKSERNEPGKAIREEKIREPDWENICGEGMSLEYFKGLIIGTFREWMDDNGKTYSAALAYYFVLSLPALLLLSVSVGSIFLKSKDIQELIFNSLEGVVDNRIIGLINLLFEQIPEVESLSISALVGFVFLLWSASNVFRHLKNFLEQMWDVQPTENGTIKSFIRNTVLSFIVVIIFGGLLVISILVESILFRSSKFLQDSLPCSVGLVQYTSSIASFLILVLFFMFIYRVLPDSKLDFKPTFVGAVVTVILITIGKYAFGIYLLYSGINSLYGVIGSIIGLFLWLYYTSIMLTIGVEFTKVYSES
ncbi:MAG: YihY/virulence factor BrkB family protein [Methanosarcinaceae archaeon]|uniref:YihY/virulence factor BrkB family protein n=1 Tax=Methanosarcina sp. MTP4 TaxID=1434100 RepID=UPI000A7C7DC4|nr:YihY/virulence factor BrkB family protein [Methanosarcina sp. MTP4]